MTLITQIGTSTFQNVFVDDRGLYTNDTGENCSIDNILKIVAYPNGYVAFHSEIQRNGVSALNIVQTLLPTNEDIENTQNFGDALVDTIHANCELRNLGFVISSMNNGVISTYAYKTGFKLVKREIDVLFNGGYDNNHEIYAEIFIKLFKNTLGENIGIETIIGLDDIYKIQLFQVFYDEISHKSKENPSSISNRLRAGVLKENRFEWIKEDFNLYPSCL